MDYKLYDAQTRQSHEAWSKSTVAASIFQLEKKELFCSASRWTSRHLTAYRLLVLPERAWLPVLDHAECPHCASPEDDASSSQPINRTWTKVLTGPTPPQLRDRTESELAFLPGGFFWAALGRAVNRQSGVDVGTRSYPTRDRRAVDRQSYISSDQHLDQDASSSPTQPPGSSPPVSSDYQASSAGDRDDDGDDATRGDLPEEVTVCLATSFLQHVLSLCLPQPSSARHEVRARIERRTSVALMRGGGIRLIAQDDGGVCKAKRKQEGGWDMFRPELALLEAKRSFQSMDVNPKTDRPEPKVSNKHLAQYLGEAVAVWRANQPRLGNDVFLIAAVNTFVSILHFKFGSEYLNYVEAPDEVSQQVIMDADNNTNKSFVQMQRTRWLDLSTRPGRETALCHILALVRWDDARPHEDELESEYRGVQDSADDDSDQQMEE